VTGGGAAVEVTGLTWRPAGRRAPVLDGLDLRIRPGEKVLLAGPSGSGKSTLLRAIAGLLLTADVGDLSGSVSVDGREPQERPGGVGLLLQDPSAGIVARRVGRDVAFGLENTCVPRAEMPARVHRVLEAVGFPYDEQRHTGSLSGGETQRLALAGALALEPQVLLLDEPTAMLDTDNAARVRRSVLDVCAERGTTLVVVEHHLEPWLDHVDRAVVLDGDGAVVADGPPRQVLAEQGESLAAQGIWVPGLAPPSPLEVDPALVTPWAGPREHGALVSARRLAVRHRSPFARHARRAAGPAVLSDVSCDLDQGRALTLRGPSGAGKSTLLAVLAGLARPDQGSAEIHPDLAGRRGRSLSRLSSRELATSLAWVPQLPEHGIVRNTVLGEMMLTATALGAPTDAAHERATGLLDAVGLGHRASSSTHHLSGGEQRRLVVAAALTHGPSGLLLDEPTAGQDRRTWAAVMGICLTAVDAGTGLAVATHDQDAVAATAPVGDVLDLAGGRVREVRRGG